MKYSLLLALIVACSAATPAQSPIDTAQSHSTASLAASPQAASAPAQTLDKAKLDQFLDRLLQKNKAMGTLTIVKEGNVIYNRSFGYSHISGTEKKPLTAATRYPIGSVTKMYTAAIILQLVDEKKLKLTDTLDKFFPQIANAQKITMAQILAHRSGIHDALIDRNLRPASKTAVVTKEELLAIISKGTPDFEPDTKHAYSNSGYTLLGLIIEKITGKPYEAVVKDRITTKLGLQDTFVSTTNADVSKNETPSYRWIVSEWKEEPETHPSILFSAGAIVSTTTDLAKFAEGLFNGKLVSNESLEQMKTIRDGDGLGMEPFQFAGKTFYGHTGGGDNYGSWLAYLPEERLAIVYTTNAKVFPVINIMRGVADIYYNKPFEIPTFEAVVVSAETLDKYVGVYSSTEAPVKFTITRRGETLFVQPGEQSPAPLEATAQDKFKIEPPGVFFEFDAAKNQMSVKRGPSTRIFTKDK